MFSPLEVTLISVLSAFVVVAVVYISLMTRNLRNRRLLFVVLDQAIIPGGIVFVGDSITDFYPIQDFFQNRLIYNQGIAGDTTTGVLSRLNHVYNAKPQKIFLQIGTNDLGHLARPHKVVERIGLIVEAIKENLPNTELHIISLYPVAHWKMWLSPIITGFRTKKKLQKVNKGLEELCLKEGITYIDIFSHLATPKGSMAHENTLDGIHSSAIGYQIVSRELTKYID